MNYVAASRDVFRKEFHGVVKAQIVIRSTVRREPERTFSVFTYLDICKRCSSFGNIKRKRIKAAAFRFFFEHSSRIIIAYAAAETYVSAQRLHKLSRRVPSSRFSMVISASISPIQNIISLSVKGTLRPERPSVSYLSFG